MKVDKHNIPLEYKIPLQGKMNKGVYDCLNSGYGEWCSGNVSHRQAKYAVVEDIIGFAESDWGTMVVWQCKECGQKQFFHLRPNQDTGFDHVKAYHEYKITGKY